MISFFIGGVTSDREKKYIDSIERSVDNGKNVIVIIPDQFSFEYDKKLYSRLGAVRFNKITTAGFNRIAEILENRFGSNGSGYVDDNAKIILMYKALRVLRTDNKLTYYARLVDKKAFEKGNLISQLIELIQQLRESGITYEILCAASVGVKGTLALKLHDIGEIYKEYMHQLECAGLKDLISGVSAAIEIARKNSFFGGCDVYIDAFSSFTYDELKMLELCFAHADNVFVSLVIDCDSVKNRIHPFKLTEMTLGTLKSMAKNIGYTVVQANETVRYNSDIAYAGKNLFNISKKPLDKASENIRVLNADDIYSEASFVCAQIKEFTRHGYKYSDMAVILRNLSDSSSVFESTMEKYDIPYFIDKAENVSSSSIVQYFNTVFSCLTTRKYKTENLLKLVKSPFFTPNKHNANLIESYCIKWNINGDMWTKEFFGLDLSLVDDESELKHLKTIESIRKKIIDPFDDFKCKCGKNDIPAGEMCEEFFALLNKIGISQRTYSVVRNSVLKDNQTQIELSRGLRQLWNSILSAVKSIYDCLGNDPISIRQFYELFRVMVSQMSVANPPQKVDCVRIADASHSRLSDVKVTFVCQVNDGIFPQTVSSNSLLSRIDMSGFQDALKGLSVESRRSFLGDVRYTFMNEELVCYNAISIASDKLFLTYVNADLTGEEKRPSVLVGEILKSFSKFENEKISNIPVDFFCTSEKTAFHTAVEHFRDDSAVISAVKMSLKDSQYGYKLESLKSDINSLTASSKTKPDPEISSRTFFKDSVANISASQIDSYYKCPFAYFCRYGLRLRPVEVMEMSPNHKGTLVHKVLENVFSFRNEEGKLVFSEENYENDVLIKSIISECFDKYYKDSLNSDFGKTGTFIYDYNLLKNITYRIVKYVQTEIKMTRFIPSATEYSFGPNSDQHLIEFSTDGGRKLSVSGSIDRVDVSNENNSEYVRIIDYKTGAISIDYAHLQCGLNLQMLVYLDAYLKSEGKNENTVPAGIEYMSFGGRIEPFKDSAVPESQYAQIESSNVKKAFKPKGIVVNREDTISIFNRDGLNSDFDYAPFKKNAKETLPEEEFGAIREYACQKVVEFGNALENGKFPMNAVGSVCNYCDYRSVCNKDKFEDTSGLSDNKKALEEKFRETLKIIMENKGGEHK